jgi:hypothetical protein
MPANDPTLDAHTEAIPARVPGPLVRQIKALIEQTREVKWMREQMQDESAARYHAVGDEPLRMDAGHAHAEWDLNG